MAAYEKSSNISNNKEILEECKSVIGMASCVSDKHNFEWMEAKHIEKNTNMF